MRHRLWSPWRPAPVPTTGRASSAPSATTHASSTHASSRPIARAVGQERTTSTTPSPSARPRADHRCASSRSSPKTNRPFSSCIVCAEAASLSTPAWSISCEVSSPNLASSSPKGPTPSRTAGRSSGNGTIKTYLRSPGKPSTRSTASSASFISRCWCAKLSEFRRLLYTPDSAPALSTLRARINEIPGGMVLAGHYYVDLDEFDRVTKLRQKIDERRAELRAHPLLEG